MDEGFSSQKRQSGNIFQLKEGGQGNPRNVVFEFDVKVDAKTLSMERAKDFALMTMIFDHV